MAAVSNAASPCESTTSPGSQAGRNAGSISENSVPGSSSENSDAGTHDAANARASIDGLDAKTVRRGCLNGRTSPVVTSSLRFMVVTARVQMMAERRS